MASFAAAPNSLVNNPDSQNGVTLHAMLDETNLMLQDFPNKFADFNLVKASSFGTAAERTSLNAVNILAAKRLAFRYAIFANTHSGGTSSGMGEIGGNDFMVTFGGWTLIGGTADQKAGTFMHELGHTLGLRHGGDDNDQFKPNYYSVMNYLWQTPKPTYSAHWKLDYSTQKLPDLNESNLNETAGIQGPAGVQVPIGPQGGPRRLADMSLPVDWSSGDEDGDGTSDNDAGVAIDVNEDGAMSNLDGYEDWSHLIYAFRHSEYFDDGVVYEPDPNDIELTRELDQQINEDLVDLLTGDYNLNGGVDAADYVVWRKTLDSSTELAADGSGNKTVDQADYLVWRANFGTTLPLPASGRSAIAATDPIESKVLTPPLFTRAENHAAEPTTLVPVNFFRTDSQLVGSQPQRRDLQTVALSHDKALLAWLASEAQGTRREYPADDCSDEIDDEDDDSSPEEFANAFDSVFAQHGFFT